MTNKVTVQNGNGANTLIVATPLEGNDGNEVDVSVPGSTTNQAHEIAIQYADLKQIVLYSDGPLTIKGNSTGSPDYTWTLPANTPVVWNYGSPQANPFGTTNTTGWYLTNAGGAAVKLRGYVLQNHS